MALLNQSIYNARTLARGLSPVSLERGGLVPALRTLAARARETYGLSLTLRTRLTHPLRVDESAANHLYRIVQEALSNAMRHGRATRVRIQLSSTTSRSGCRSTTTGAACPRTRQRAVGLGLRTMRYRAQVVGGDLLVTNHRLGGTIVRCVCPQGARERVLVGMPMPARMRAPTSTSRAHAQRRPPGRRSRRRGRRAAPGRASIRECTCAGSKSGFGQRSGICSSSWRRICETAKSRNHLRSAGITYQGACSVLHFEIADSNASR